FFTTSLRLRGSSSFVGRALYTAAHVRLRFPFRAAFPLARKRRDSMQPTQDAQAVCENIFKKTRRAAAPSGFFYIYATRHATAVSADCP
ncbi:hypothetical protein, partial [Burkholderia multivorans]|uniref:hypothetical protein n=5 Tax=Burkholderiaceae TaxID=119060 RepID=UPI001C65CAFE